MKLKVALGLLLFFTAGTLKADPFKEPLCFKNSVDFWESVYTKYGQNQTIFHNDRTFEIYKVATIPPPGNKQRKRALKAIKRELKKTLSSSEFMSLHAQAGVKERFMKGLDIGKKLIPQMQKQFTSQNMPGDLALIPLIESSFQFNAKSRVGARGAWQIMPATLRLYKKVHKNKLNGLDFSTAIAILIFQDNYENLHSWPMSINAYHSGLGRLLKASKQLNTNDMCEITTKYTGRGYRFASRNYYAQFLAAKRVYYKGSKKIESKVDPTSNINYDDLRKSLNEAIDKCNKDPECREEN